MDRGKVFYEQSRELDKFPQMLGIKAYKKLYRSFRALCVNGSNNNVIHDLDYYMTEDSYKRGFESVFGYNHELLSSILFKFMT